MSKSIQRDIQVLYKILKYLDKIKISLSKNRCTNLSNFINCEDCKDMCSFYILQVYELGKKLTSDSKNSISILCNGSMTPVRNMIAHDYVNLNVAVLYAFVIDCVSANTYNQVKSRLSYCQNSVNRRKN